MKFQDKYTDEEEENEKQNKKLVSKDAFALGSVIQELIDKIEHTRRSLIK